jgi:hypothetical protein
MKYKVEFDHMEKIWYRRIFKVTPLADDVTEEEIKESILKLHQYKLGNDAQIWNGQEFQTDRLKIECVEGFYDEESGVIINPNTKGYYEVATIKEFENDEL